MVLFEMSYTSSEKYVLARAVIINGIRYYVDIYDYDYIKQSANTMYEIKQELNIYDTDYTPRYSKWNRESVIVGEPQ